MLLIKNGKIKTMVGADIENGCVLIGDDGKIQAIGTEIAQTEDMIVIDAEGLPYEAAWRAITVNPADQMGIGDRVGSLAVGKDGDVVVWCADPLREIGAKAYVTVVDGTIVYGEGLNS